MSATDDKASDAIREAAAEWVIRFGASQVTHTEKRELAEWLRRSPQHVKEYLRAEADWAALDGAAQADSSDIRNLIEQGSSNVVGLVGSEGRGQGKAEGHPRNNSRWIALATAAAIALVIGVVAFAPRWVERLNPNIYSTGVGEQMRIVLADGSSVELNTRTKVRVDFSSGSRNVYLQEGEAFFSVAKETARPFRVFSHAAVVRAIGTQFNVYAPHDDTVVTVLEGRVAVSARDEPSTSQALPVEVEAGRVARVEPEKPTTVAAVRPDSAIAWRQRRLIFENEPLAGVAAEFNRYNVQQLIVTDGVLAARRISGTFDPNKPGDLVGFLTQHGEVRADTAADRIVLSAAPSPQTLSGSGIQP